jgi:predicted deacetylase
VIPSPAQYLLRFDDLCPTVSYPRWQRFLPLIEEFGLRPILAVIPDNQDRELILSPPDPEFWARMRAMEAAGATIALHGYRHLCQSQGKSLLPLHRHSEFAGVEEETQGEWIREGLGILRGQGLHPGIFVAPRHGFDQATLRALSQEGIQLLSDGFARLPFTRGGLTWIPQQLWAPVAKTRDCGPSASIATPPPTPRLPIFRHFSANTPPSSPPWTAYWPSCDRPGWA